MGVLVLSENKMRDVGLHDQEESSEFGLDSFTTKKCFLLSPDLKEEICLPRQSLRPNY
jgi:hypothetical protein